MVRPLISRSRIRDKKAALRFLKYAVRRYDLPDQATIDQGGTQPLPKDLRIDNAREE
jgi:hypothetical protein